MAHYTSRAEGLKIKEYKDYYDWNDDIRIRYNPNSSNANWVFTSLFEEGIWMNGILYPQNSVIASFKDGVEVNYTMMAQHKTYDETTGEVISVTNILYRVTSSITTNAETSTPIVQGIPQQNEEIEIGDELPDEITYTIKSLPNGNHKDVEVKKYKNGTLVGTSRITPDKITAYKVAHSQAVYKEYQVFNHLGFLWHGQNPESGYPQYSYTVMSRCDYLEVNGSQYGPHDYITTWTWDQDINLTVYDYSTPAVPYIPEDDKYPVIEVQFDTKAGSHNTVIISKISDGVTVSSKEVTSEEILKSKFKGSRLRIFENFLMDFNNDASEQAFSVYADSNYIKYNGTYVGQNKEIESWPAISNVSFKVVDETNRYTKTIKKNDSFVVHLTINGSGDQDLKKGDKIYSAVFHDHIKMYYNGKYHYAAWLAYDQPNVPGHYKTLGGIAIGWCRPYWVLITTAEGIYFGGRTYQARKLLKTWDDEDTVHLTLTQKKARKKTELNDKDSEIIKYTIITGENSNKINLTKYVNDLETTKSSFNPELVENRTFNGIAFTIANGIINLYSKSDYVKFQNEGYRAKTFITSWAINEKANLEVYDKDFDKIQYVMDTSLSSNVITITKEINDLVDDTVEFNPDTTANLDFHNIRFSVRNGKVYVYSKSDFIKLSGSTYKKGNQIINWPIEEKVYFAIVDESIKYEVVTSITYNVDTEQVTEVDYLIETIGDEQWKPLRVQKRVPVKDPITGRVITYNLAGEEIINYYDCVRPPYYIYDDKLQFEFNLGYYVWYLKSASDDVYVNNEQYPAGTLIRSWNWANVVSYDDIGHVEDSHKEIRIKSTTVDTKKSYETTHEYITNPTYTVETKTDDRTLILTCDQPGSSTVTHNLTWHEIHSVTWYTFYELQFNYTTETGWTMRANSNLIVVSNKRLRKGETISKWGYSDNIDMTVNVLLEDIKHTQKTDVEKALMVSTEDEWLYGYIWKRFGGPTPPPSIDIYEILIPIAYSDYYGYENNIVGITRNLDEISSTWHNTSSIDAGLDFMGKVSTRIYYSASITGNGRSLLFANLNGSEWDEVDGFDPGAIIGLINMTTAVVYNYVTERIQVYNVFSSARKSIDNDSSESISNRSSLELIDASSISNVVLKGSWSGWDFFIYDFETNSITDHISDKVRLDAEEARAIYDYYHYDPSTGWIDRQQILGYSVGIEPYTFVLNKRVYCFMRRVYVHYNGGYIHTPEGRIEYDVADWECCAYTIDKNGISSIHKNVMTPEGFDEFVYRPGKSGPFEHNGAYYFIYNTDDPETAYITIASFDPTTFSFVIAKTINKDSYILVRNFISGKSSDYIKVYFDGRAYSYENNEIGIGGLSYTYSKGSYVYSTKRYPGSSKKLYIFFANPLLETNPGNFVMSEDTRFRD